MLNFEINPTPGLSGESLPVTRHRHKAKGAL